MTRGSKDQRGPTASARRFATGVALALMGIAGVAGVWWRLRMLLMDRSLWLDPAMLALNVVGKDWLALLGPLDLNQSAPFGFLLMSKWLGGLFDYSEFALTFVPFLLGIAALFAFCLLARERLEPVSAAITCILFAACSTAVYYSGEFKQYSGDLFATVLVLYLTHRVLRHHFETRWIAAFTIGGVVAICVSHPAPIMIASSCVVLVIRSQKERGMGTARLVAAFTTLASVYLMIFVVQIRPSVPEAVIRYHAAGYAPVWPLSADTLRWWLTTVAGYGAFPLGFGRWAWLPLVALVGGLISIAANTRERHEGCLLVLPWLLLAAISAAHLYPIETGGNEVNSRFLLFTVPLAILLIARGVEWVSDFTPWPVTASLAIGFVLILPPTARMVRWPNFTLQEMRPLVVELIRNRQPSDSIYVFHPAVPAFRFYTRMAPVEFTPGTPLTDGAADIARELSRVPRDTRLWVVISHDYSGYRKAFKRELRRRYPKVITTRYPGAWLLLADPSASPSP